MNAFWSIYESIRSAFFGPRKKSYYYSIEESTNEPVKQTYDSQSNATEESYCSPFFSLDELKAMKKGELIELAKEMGCKVSTKSKKYRIISDIVNASKDKAK